MRRGMGSKGASKHPREHPLPCCIREFQPGMSVPISKGLIGCNPAKKLGDRVSRELPGAAWVSSLRRDASTCAHSAKRNSRGAQHDKPTAEEHESRCKIFRLTNYGRRLT